MKISKFISTETIIKELKETADPELSNLQYRRSGRTLGIAISTIGGALSNSGTSYNITDHYGTNEANMILIEVVQNCLNALNLKHYTLDRTAQTLTFHMFY